MKKWTAVVAGFVAFCVVETAWARCQCTRRCDQQIYVADSLPANVDGIAAWQTWTEWENIEVQLQKEVDGATTQVEATVNPMPATAIGDVVLIVPDEPWEVGANYSLFLSADSEVVDDIACGRGNARSLSSSFEIVEPLTPDVSPTLSVGDTERLSTDWEDGDEVCENELDTLRVPVSWELPEELAGFESLVQWQIEVDGEPVAFRRSACVTVPPGTSPTEDTTDFVAVACSPWEVGYPSEPARQAGTKELQVVGRIAGTETTFATDTVSVDLSCEPLPEPMLEEEEGGCATGSGDAGLLALLLGLFVIFRRRT